MEIVVRNRNLLNYLLAFVMSLMMGTCLWGFYTELIKNGKLELVLLFASVIGFALAFLMIAGNRGFKMVFDENGIKASSQGLILFPKNTSRYYPWKNALCLDHDGWSYLAGYHLEIADERGSQVTIILNWFHTNRASALAVICEHIDSSKITERAEKSLRRILRKNDK